MKKIFKTISLILLVCIISLLMALMVVLIKWPIYRSINDNQGNTTITINGLTYEEMHNTEWFLKEYKRRIGFMDSFMWAIYASGNLEANDFIEVKPFAFDLGAPPIILKKEGIVITEPSVDNIDYIECWGKNIICTNIISASDLIQQIFSCINAERTQEENGKIENIGYMLCYSNTSEEIFYHIALIKINNGYFLFVTSEGKYVYIQEEFGKELELLFK